MSRAVSSGALRAVASRLASAPAASATRPAPRFAFERAGTHPRPSFDAPSRDFRAPAWAPLVDACRPASTHALRRAPPSFAASAGATRGLSGKTKRFVTDGKTSKGSAESGETLPEPPPRAAARGGGSGRVSPLSAEPLEVLPSVTKRFVFPDRPLVAPALAANEGGARRSACVEAGRHASTRGAHAGARKSREGASKDGRGCVPARSNAKRGAGRVADAAGAEASREATARSAPLDTARDMV